MSGRGGDRGQINFDFAVGVSILVVTIIIAFSFIPGIFGGITEGRAQSDKVVADRISEWIVTEGLADPHNPGELDLHCTNSFFSPAAALDHCGFSSNEIDDNLELDYDRSVYVTLERGGDIQCWRGANWRTGQIADSSVAGCVDEYRAGNPPPTSQEVAVSRRAVTVGATNVILVVRVW